MSKRSKAKGAAITRPTPTASGTSAVVSQPSVRTQVTFTPPMLRALELQVDSGELWRLADLCDQIMADDRVGELLETLAGEVLGSELTFEQGPRSNAGSAEKSAELDADWPHGIDDDELTSLTSWTELCGVGFAKREQWVENDGRVVPVIKWWHPKHFCYDFPARTWMVRDALGTKTPIRGGDGTWIIATRRGEFRPWASGLYRGLARWWMLKSYAIGDWGTHSEKSSKLVVTSPDGSTSPDRNALVKDIFAAAKDAVIALPLGFDMKLIELTADTRMIYEAQVNAANTAFSVAILGQNLTTQVEAGSRAAAEVHAGKENRKVRYVAQRLGKTLHTQLLPWWALFNFGDPALAPYPKYHTEPPEDVLEKATGLKMLGDALGALKLAGWKLSAEQIEEEYGVALEELPEPEPLPLTAAGLPAKPGAPGAPRPAPQRPPPSAAKPS